jgi:hypothetical protein
MEIAKKRVYGLIKRRILTLCTLFFLGNQNMFGHQTRNNANIIGFFGKRLRLHEADFEAVAKCWKVRKN